MINGIFIIFMMIAFFAIVFWAYSDKQKTKFDYMSNLPLERDLHSSRNNKGDENGND